MKLKYTIVSFFSIIALFLFSFPHDAAFAWDNLTGGDHGGADWTISSNTTLAGVHTNIGNFTINSGVTVTVQPFNGSSYGSLSISANSINIQGTINANSAGYGGGGGGGGGSMSTPGGGGAGVSGGTNGATGNVGVTYPRGGVGGNGGGSYGGLGGQCEWQDCSDPADLGGYYGSQINGDTSINEDVIMGSGGGGGMGGYGGANSDLTGAGGGGGGAGGKGGGMVKLITANTLNVSGAIYTKGDRTAGNGVNGACYSGGAGGNAGSIGSSAGGLHATSGGACEQGSANGQNGAAGAGGGILLKGNSVSLAGSTIDARGGDNLTTNGGTLKVFFSSSYVPGTIYAGRVYTPETVVDGICGTANGVETPIAPTTGLCSAGNPSAVTGTDPWYWDCVGLNGGSTASCSSNVTAVDSGLRARIGGITYSIALEPMGTVTSPLRIRKGTTTFGVILVETTALNALPIRIKTASGIKALAQI